jgi:hypothetical protein
MLDDPVAILKRHATRPRPGSLAHNLIFLQLHMRVLLALPVAEMVERDNPETTCLDADLKSKTVDVNIYLARRQSDSTSSIFRQLLHHFLLRREWAMI